MSWNPGNDTHRIVGYKIYWDADPGASTPYAFNSVTNAGQVVIAGTTATISGLTPGTTYYFTVTSLSDFAQTPNPSTDPPVLTHYESIKYPTTVSGDPSFSYPIEVAATTTGGGVAMPVPDGIFGTAMRASRADAPGSTIALTWDVATCTSVDHHVLYGDLSSVSTLSVTGAACNLGTTEAPTGRESPRPTCGSSWPATTTPPSRSWGTDGVGGQRGGTTPRPVWNVREEQLGHLSVEIVMPRFYRALAVVCAAVLLSKVAEARVDLGEPERSGHHGRQERRGRGGRPGALRHERRDTRRGRGRRRQRTGSTFSARLLDVGGPVARGRPVGHQDDHSGAAADRRGRPRRRDRARGR